LKKSSLNALARYTLYFITIMIIIISNRIIGCQLTYFTQISVMLSNFRVPFLSHTPPFSGQKSKPRRTPVEPGGKQSHLLRLFSDPEDGGDMFLRNFG
jgi:hypothetical protein